MKQTLIVFAFGMLFTGCIAKLGRTNPLDPNTATNVYIAGTIYDGTKQSAVYWRNGYRTVLATDNGNYFITGIVVTNGDVYVCGRFYNFDTSQNVACYFKNGTRIDLPAGMTSIYGTGIAVNGSDVYVSGYYYNGTYEVPCYWKNGVRTALSAGTSAGGWQRATRVVVRNGVVYISGMISNEMDDTLFPCYWYNGFRNDLSGCTANDIFNTAIGVDVFGGNVYVAGMVKIGSYTYGNYWRNGVRTQLAGAPPNTDTIMRAMFLSGSDIYTVGEYATNGVWQPVYWKNTMITRLINPVSSTSYGYCRGIGVSGSDVYVAGHWYNGVRTTACMWKNGVLSELDSSGSVNSEAHAIFLQIN